MKSDITFNITYYLTDDGMNNVVLKENLAKTTAKTARGVKNLVLQTGAPVTLGALAVYGAWKNPAVRSFVTNTGKTAYSAAKNSDFTKAGVEFVKNLRK